MKKVKYKITNDFGTRHKDGIIDCLLIEEDVDVPHGLVLHPSNKRLGECACLEMVQKEDDYWISMTESSYINISNKLEKKLLKLLK